MAPEQQYIARTIIPEAFNLRIHKLVELWTLLTKRARTPPKYHIPLIAMVSNIWAKGKFG